MTNLRNIVEQQLIELHGEQADSFAQEAARHFGVELGEKIATGHYGTAYKVRDQPLVLKVTSSKKELLASEKLKNKKTEYLAEVHDVYFSKTDKRKGARLIEYVDVLSKEEAQKFSWFLHKIEQFYIDTTGLTKKRKNRFWELNYLKARKHFQEQMPEYVKYLNDIQNIIRELQTYNIESFDFHSRNLGYKNGHLVLFDF